MLRTLLSITLLLLSCASLGAQEQATEDESDPYWFDETLEDMVTPLKQWVEDQVHSSDAPTENIFRDSDLRQAIKKALAIFPGTVLSAQYLNQQYKIKIISEQGVIDVVTINMEEANETPAN